MKGPKFPRFSRWFSFKASQGGASSLVAWFKNQSRQLFPHTSQGEASWWSARTQREKVLLSIFGATVVSASLYIFVLEGQLDEFTVLSNELPASKQKLESAKVRIANLSQLEQQLADSRTRNSQLFRAYPSELSTGSMAVLVGEAAKAANVSVKYFVPKSKLERPDSNGKLVAETPVSMVVEGTFDALVDFSARLENLRGGALVRNFAFTWENREKEKETKSKDKGSDGKKDSVNVLLELIDVVVTTFSKTPSGDVDVQQKSVGNVTTRLPRAAYPPDSKNKPKTTILNAAFTVSFFEVGLGGSPDAVDLEQYRLGRPNPFEPHVWDDTNPWLHDIGDIPASQWQNGATTQGTWPAIGPGAGSGMGSGAKPKASGESTLPSIPSIPSLPNIPGFPFLPSLTPNASKGGAAPVLSPIPLRPPQQGGAGASG
ncbi:type 4a pilus biogenesis protein PilO [Heliobacterium gestii]|uniref:Type 4a pilus biogenesis protein PilO n=1 Tax=Heliomicrobium gestii TaxID=2699 RepID=A0A845LIM8_HELGE|nr:type 4a pilus biogenesis protein PilO [Heliomicrobium gestii]MBM7867895.1 Tfp pilus assembly protein PilO [Heliomicrobium gestii]MZP43293.1 type 4a pilus biogenesis protein PilO [Heliomicrobium gestii]